MGKLQSYLIELENGQLSINWESLLLISDELEYVVSVVQKEINKGAEILDLYMNDRKTIIDFILKKERLICVYSWSVSMGNNWSHTCFTPSDLNTMVSSLGGSIQW